MLAWEIPARRGEGGEEWLGKKDTGYLYKAFMVARHPPKAWRSVTFRTKICLCL
jgi:hypothetical protein